MIRSKKELYVELVKLAKKKVNKGLAFLANGINARTPEDTKTLLGNNEKIQAKTEGNFVIGKVVNNTEYAFFVENGVKGGGYKFRKPKGNVFYQAPVGEGAGMYRRTFLDDKKKILKAMD